MAGVLNDGRLPAARSPAASFRPTRAVLGQLTVAALLLAAAAVSWRLQTGNWWPAPPHGARWLGAGATLLAYLGLSGWLLWRSRPPARARLADRPADEVLVVYASQTGFARELAERSADSLERAGLSTRRLPIEQLDGETLAATARVLFVASTTGEGDAPDHALGFLRGAMRQAPELARLRYAVLALGDRDYEDFCAFGRRLDDWLHGQGAQRLFDRVEVDNADGSALRHWQYHLGRLAGATGLPDWAPPEYGAWRLASRRELNPGSAGGGVFHLSLLPPAGVAPTWQAGDIAEIGPRQPPQAVADLLYALRLDPYASVAFRGARTDLADALSRSRLPMADRLANASAQAIADSLEPLPHREYSIASLPADGSLQLLVRRMTGPEGRPGLGSGWLCDHLMPGAVLDLRIRSNPGFHPPVDGSPLILIGNGTGIAGLRALLKARIAAGEHRNWLLFGERNADRDHFFRDEIETWRARGTVPRVDAVFSRDPGGCRYVQHRLLETAETLRSWVDEGAAIYVCGSLQGMAPGVDAALRQVLGHAAMDALQAAGRYRRDVY